MKDKINVAELLKDCPKGMELDCTIFDGVYFDHVNDLGVNKIKCYVNNSNEHFEIALDKYGQYVSYNSAKCVIFPKGKNTWEGFQRPFKDGDIVTWKDRDRSTLIAFIYKERKNVSVVKHHFALYTGGLGTFIDGEISLVESELVFATEEEKAELFDAIKANGYKWNPETKTLEKIPYKEEIARSAANTWCRCFKCDKIIRGSGYTCEKEKLQTCHQWYDAYRAALLALSDERIKEL